MGVNHYTNKNAYKYGYRSGLEEKVGNQLKKAGVKAKYEPFQIEYEQPAKKRKYTPDFVLPNGIIIETKGRFTTQDRQKHLYIKKCLPDLDIRFVFQNSRTKLYKGAKSSYGDWCTKHNFKFTDKLIAEEWLNE